MFLTKRAHHGEVFRSHVFGNDAFVLGGPEAVRWIFAGENAMRAMVFEIAVAFIVGTEGVPIRRLAELFETMVKGLFSSLPFDLPLTPFGKAVRARRELDAELGRILDRRRGREEEADRARARPPASGPRPSSGWPSAPTARCT